MALINSPAPTVPDVTPELPVVYLAPDAASGMSSRLIVWGMTQGGAVCSSPACLSRSDRRAYYGGGTRLVMGVSALHSIALSAMVYSGGSASAQVTSMTELNDTTPLIAYPAQWPVPPLRSTASSLAVAVRHGDVVHDAAMVCNISLHVQRRDGRGSASASIAVAALPVAWPHLAAVYKLSVEHAVHGVPKNASDVAALRYLRDVVGPGGDATRAVPHVATTATAASVLNIIVSGNTTLLLHCSPGHAFMPGMTAWVGDVAARVLAVSSDGSLAVVQLPPYGAMCGMDGAACTADSSYRALWLVNPPVSQPGWQSELRRVRAGGSPGVVWHVGDHSTVYGSSSSVVIQAHSDQVLGGMTVCPHACPGGAPAGVVPASTTAWLRWSSASATAVPSDDGYGLYISEACGGYLVPGPHCLQPGALCAWGSGASCMACPEGAVCPGGQRMWVTAGWWVSSEASTAMPVRCRAPAEQRCTGHDVVARAGACGAGYAGYACASCAHGYYPLGLSACAACPAESLSSSLLGSLVVLGGAALGLLALTVAGVQLCTRGTPWKQSAVMAADWVTWVASVLQVVAQSSVLLPGSTPGVGRVLMSSLDMVLLNSDSVTHSACMSVGPLTVPMLQLGMSAVVGAVWLILVGSGRWCSMRGINACLQSSWMASGSEALGLLVVLLYPLSMDKALSMLSCSPRAVKVLVAYDMDAVESITRWHLVQQPDVQCFAGEHWVAVTLAVLALMLHGVAVPVVAWLSLRTFARQHGMKAAPTTEPRRCDRLHRCTHPEYKLTLSAITTASAGIKPFLTRVYDVSHWRMHLLALVVLMASTVSRAVVLVARYAGGAMVAHACMLTVLMVVHSTVLVLSKPYTSQGGWKLPVQLTVSLVAAVMAWSEAVGVLHEAYPELVWLGTLSMGMTWAVLVGVALAVMVLVGSFWWMLLEPSMASQLQAAQQKLHRATGMLPASGSEPRTQPIRRCCGVGRQPGVVGHLDGASWSTASGAQALSTNATGGTKSVAVHVNPMMAAASRTRAVVQEKSQHILAQFDAIDKGPRATLAPMRVRRLSRSGTRTARPPKAQSRGERME